MICLCGGNIEKVAYNCDWGLDIELWDCICDKCGHHILGFKPICSECYQGSLDFSGVNDFIDAGEGYIAAIYVCSYCMKEYIKPVEVDLIYGNKSNN